MQELKMRNLTETTAVFIDNQATINMLLNVDNGKVTKSKNHAEIKREFINQHAGNKLITTFT